MKIGGLIDAGTGFVDEFCRKTECDKSDFRENSKVAVWTVTSKILKIEFVFTKKEGTFVPAATLYSRIYLNFNDSRRLHIPEIIDKLDENDFHCYYFPYIENEEKLKNCFKVFENFYGKHLPELQRIAYDDTMREELYARKTEEYIAFMNVSEKNRENAEEVFDIYGDRNEKYLILTRYTRHDAYTDFLYGRYDKALKKYKKYDQKNNILDYEKRLLEFISQQDTPYEALFPGCSDLKKATDSVNGKENLKVMLLSWTISFIVMLSVFLSVTLLIRNYFSADTVAYLDSEAILMSYMLAGISAIFCGLAIRRPVCRIFFKKDQIGFLGYDDIVNNDKTNKFINMVFEIVLILSFAMNIWFSCMNICCYEDKMVYMPAEKLFSFEKRTKYYEDIEEVYFVDGLYNDYGDWIDRSFYVICFKDGTRLNTDDFVSEEEAREKLLPVIEEYYDEVLHVKTEDEIRN